MKLLRSDQMWQADRRTIEEIGLPGAVLMENAGAGVARLLKRRFPDWQTRRTLVLAGTGNNGGDGFVVARRLLMSGAQVRLLLFGRTTLLKGDALLQYRVFTNLGGTTHEITQPQDLTLFSATLAHSGVVVDALFGTGLHRPIEGVTAQAIDLVNRSGRPVMAVDIPSGICADSGTLLGTAIKASWTVTFAAEKIGHRLYPGAALCGEIITIPIGIPPAFIHDAKHQTARNLTTDLIIPPRPADGHKGRFGHLLIVAGSIGKEGAATLTALGALRTGPGLVSVATPEACRAIIAAKLTEAMTLPLPQGEEIANRADQWLSKIIDSGIRPTALAIGPGLGTGPTPSRFVHKLLSHFPDCPTLLDADGLNILAAGGETIETRVSQRSAPLILTPHPGELARLRNLSVVEIQADRLGIARQTAQQWQVWLVLKGADTLIAAPDGRIWINENGNSGLASGGSGDLLSGIISGTLTQGWPVESAVRGGVWLHGAAGDQAAKEREGEAGLLAGDLLAHLVQLRNGLG
ncbi:MAG: NAD(P)H-hydrate dehydratase [Magnetococcales bacterium]|nr:NAD(P)H-hydrate dehydratase [Magnetococcales bacterium]